MSVLVHVLSEDGTIDSFNTLSDSPHTVQVPEGVNLDVIEVETGRCLHLRVGDPVSQRISHDFSVLD